MSGLSSAWSQGVYDKKIVDFVICSQVDAGFQLAPTAIQQPLKNIGYFTHSLLEITGKVKVKESDSPTLYCAPVVVYKRRCLQKLLSHNNS